jgi:hypothetical protein
VPDIVLITKIVSGGQTGADQAALDFAIERGISHGGWVPSGRRTEAGILPEKYLLMEMETADYSERTEKNVSEYDVTPIITHGRPTGGTEYTENMAGKHDKPFTHIDADAISEEDAAKLLRTWISENRIEVLNVEGPSASEDPEIYKTTNSPALKPTIKWELPMDLKAGRYKIQARFRDDVWPDMPRRIETPEFETSRSQD